MLDVTTVVALLILFLSLCATTYAITLSDVSTDDLATLRVLRIVIGGFIIMIMYSKAAYDLRVIARALKIHCGG